MKEKEEEKEKIRFAKNVDMAKDIYKKIQVRTDASGILGLGITKYLEEVKIPILLGRGFSSENDIKIDFPRSKEEKTLRFGLDADVWIDKKDKSKESNIRVHTIRRY